MKLSKNKKYYHMTWILLSIIAIIIIGTIVFINQPRFGRLPQGVRKEKIVHLPNYRNGKIKNLSETKQITSEKGFIKMWLGFLFDKTEDLKPDKNLPTVKTDLWNLNRQTDVLIWFGHSSCFIQLDGKRILIDPVFGAASPVSFFNKPFNGADIYTPDDIPEIDCMIITHDHWDHLDYKTVIKLKDRTKK